MGSLGSDRGEKSCKHHFRIMEEKPTSIIDQVLLCNQEKVSQFRTLTYSHEQVENLYFCDSIQKLLKYETPKSGCKSEVESSKLREAGNIQFQGSNYKAAISKFSAAALVAPFNDIGESKSFSLALANRSCALLKLGEYNSSIADIDLAIEAGYPEENRYKLIERKAKCLANTGRNEEAKEKLNEAIKLIEFSNSKEIEKQKIRQNLQNQKKKILTGTKPKQNSDLALENKLQNINQILPAFSDAIELRYDEIRGRYGIATRDIDPGTILLEEQPVAAILKPQNRRSYCDHCLSKVSTLPVPCRTCNIIQYCSGACRNKARSTYHQHECGVIDHLDSFTEKFNDGRDLGLMHHRLCYRIMAQNKLEFYKDNLENFTQSNNEVGTDSGGAVFLPGGYQSMADLVSHSDRMDENSLLPLLLSTVAQLKMLQDTNYFAQKSQENDALTDDEKVMCKTILHFLQVMKFNTHGIPEAILTDPQRPLLVDVRSIGCGVFPTLCLLNTSCDQNITKYNEGTKVIGVASKPIKKGEEVSDNYFPAAAFQERSERRKWLKEHYWFECECNACEENLPLMEDMPEEPIRFICEKCGIRDLLKEMGKCDNCGELFDVQTRANQVIELKNRLTNTVNIYAARIPNDPKKMTEALKRDYTELRNKVAHPYKFLVLAEQQYLKSIKQVFGNHVFRKS